MAVALQYFEITATSAALYNHLKLKCMHMHFNEANILLYCVYRKVSNKHDFSIMLHHCSGFVIFSTAEPLFFLVF